MPKKNSLYWAYNLPLQVWPRHQDPEDSTTPIVDYQILNYMPRKERCCDLLLSEILEDQTHEEFFEQAAKCFENLARLMRRMATDRAGHVYYHDEGMVDEEADDASGS